jgi:hypothetical protein
MSTSAIQHIVAMPVDAGDSHQTLFQGFSMALYPDYLAIISGLAHFPHDLLDIGLEHAHLVSSRMAGADLNIRMLRVDLIDDAHCELENIPTVIWSTGKTVAEVEASLERFKFKPLHLTLGEYPGVIAMSSLTPETIHAHLLALLERAAVADDEFQVLVDAIKALPAVIRKEGQLPFVPSVHNSNRPMVDVLQKYGYQFDNAHVLEAAPDNGPYIKSMLELANVIDGLRETQSEELHAIRKNDAIIFCPSIQTHMYRMEHWNQLLRGLPRHKRNFVKNFVLRNKGFSNGQQEFDGEFFNPFADRIIGPMLAMRQFELRYFTQLVSILAANQFVAAFRLPNSVMLHHDLLSDIYYHVNSSKQGRLEELNKRLAAYGSTICSEIGSDLWGAVFNDRERLLFVCDFPAEWLPVDLVPAMFRYEISRIPSTPGNVTSHVMLAGPRLVVPSRVLTNVLVIRSFGANDPIREHLADAIKGYPLKNVSVNFVDVSSSVELIEAMNKFDGAMVVFDCHGNHGGKTEHGWLSIGKEKVDVWQLANVARMPPIVLLAACSTHPIDGSHASVANGLLRSGVLSVLGTYAPVNSAHTAILVARLLFRVEVFLPLVAKHRSCTWREIVSGFFRMSYTTDVLHDLAHTRKLITEEQFHAIHMQANTDINSGEPLWLEGIQQNVMEATGKNEIEIKTLWAQHFKFVETMLFTQLGRPENIIITDDE